MVRLGHLPAGVWKVLIRNQVAYPGLAPDTPGVEGFYLRRAPTITGAIVICTQQVPDNYGTAERTASQDCKEDMSERQQQSLSC